MSAAKGTRSAHLASLPALSGLGVLLLLAAVTTTTAASGRLQASTKADFTLTATPTSRTVQQGQPAGYTIDEQKLNGFNSAVSLTVTGLPSGTTASFSPQTLSSKTSSALTLSTGGTTPAGRYSISVTGAGGGITHGVTISLAVTAAPAPGFALTA